MWRGTMSKTLPSPPAQRVEIDQRSRTARLRLEQLEGLVVPWVRPTRSWLTQGLYRLRPSIGPRPAGASVRAGSGAPVQEAEPHPAHPPGIGAWIKKLVARRSITEEDAMPISADILNRRATQFVLWSPRPQNQPPRLVIGRLQPGNPPTVQGI